MNAQIVKDVASKLGADLCGIASIDRFADAPAGFRPTDIYANCKSVAVFAKKLPSNPLHLANCVPYTHVNDLITRDIDMLTLSLSLELEKIGISNVLVPSDDPYEHWEPGKMYGRAILSLRHAGYLAGLGKSGKNTPLIND